MRLSKQDTPLKYNTIQYENLKPTICYQYMILFHQMKLDKKSYFSMYLSKLFLPQNIQHHTTIFQNTILWISSTNSIENLLRINSDTNF